MNNIANYAMKAEYSGSFQEAVVKTEAALKREGFGILTKIDVKATLKKKLDVDYENYLILGACNPSLAYKALQAENEIGLLLPCNVIIYEREKRVYVSMIKPSVALTVSKNNQLAGIAKQVEEKLNRALNSITSP